MNLIQLKSVLGYLFLHFFMEAVNSKRCCPPDQYLLKNETVCWDSQTNETSQINMPCKKYVFIRKFIERDGKLVLISLGKEIGPLNVSFCINDVAIGERRLNLSIIQNVAVTCATEIDPKETVFGYCMIVSVIFLAITVAIYSSFSNLRDLFGKSIISYCGSMAIALALLAIIKLMAYSDMSWCAVRGFLAYFFLISSFFWSNAISIQILLCSRAPALFSAKSSFLWYSLYAWGCPAVLTICMAIVNFHPGDHAKPGLGLNHCWFASESQRWYYMYSVMSVLIILNMCIYVYCATLVCRKPFSSAHIKEMRYKLWLMIRLLVLMGLFWIFEMISTFTEAHIVWTILDVFNTLQGFLMFVVLVVLRPRVIKTIHQRGLFFCMSGMVEKCLAVVDDAEDECIVHTEVAMTDK